jgi:hypothetical protein
MKNIFSNFSKASALIVTWAGALTLLGVYLFRTYSVVPTFPYYYTLLLQVKDAAYALWGYFDGVHYLRLIDHGYVDIGTQAFFPLYPLMVRGVAMLTPLSSYASGVLVSLFSLACALVVLWKLFPQQKIIYTTTLLVSPVSFFFAGLYTESLFLALSLSFFLAIKREKYMIAATLAGLASATRLVGVFLALALVLYLYKKTPKITPPYAICLILISLSGFLAYAYFLGTRFGDPLMFLHVQSMFGANRSGGELVLLPQVLYRYVRMILTVDPTTFLYQRIWLEVMTFVVACFAWYKNLRHNSVSISTYVGLSLLLPTLTGTLSSFPRYTLVLIPFLLPVKMRYAHYSWLIPCSLLLLIYLFAQFAAGTFVA